MRMVVILMLLCVGLFSACKDKSADLTKQKVEVVEVKKPEPVAPPKETPKPVVKEMNYYLIAGCFELRSNAERLHAQLTKAGYKSKMIPFYNMTLVTYDGYETRQEAQVALNKIIREPEKEYTWVYPLK